MTPVSTASSAGPIERAFVVLQAVVGADEPIGVRELGRRTGLPRSTASRLVATLETLGMVERTGAGRVAPGSALATLALGVGPSPLLRDQLRPLLTDLVDRHNESVALAVDDGDAVLYVSQIDCANAVRAPDVHDERHPFHVVAHGLALRAWWDTERVDDYLSQPLVAPTANSVIDPATIRRRLAVIRSDGYVWTEGEFSDEVNGLAVVVFRQREPVASVGVYGPSYRLSPETRPELPAELASTVAERSAMLL